MAASSDDWLLHSLEKYEGIFMFELPHSTRILEWDSCHGAAVWVVCVYESSSEILQLALPERLLPTQCQSLWAKRDFKIETGGLTESCISAMKARPGSQSVVTSTCEALQIWEKSEHSSDLLEGSYKVQLWPTTPHYSGHTFLDTTPTFPSLFLIGSAHNSSSVHTFDLISKSTTFTLEGVAGHTPECPLHSCNFLPDGAPSTEWCIATCGGPRGRICIWDSREKLGQPSLTFLPVSSQGDMSFSLALRGGGASPQAAAQLARLTASGRVDLFDFRIPSTPVGVATVSDTSYRFARSTDHTLPYIQYSPDAPHLISTSGVHPGVKIYDTSDWTNTMSDATPTFVHDGHEVECREAYVLSHTWLPSRHSPGKLSSGVMTSTMLSADSEGSLHAWQWKPPDPTHPS